jgi:hypothetical protein
MRRVEEDEDRKRRTQRDHEEHRVDAPADGNADEC